MKKITLTTIFLFAFLISNLQLLAQTTVCDGFNAFEETGGKLVIDPELAVLNSNWKVGTTIRTDYTGDGYLYWDGSSSFNTPPGSELVFNIKINTPGTYEYQWRTSVGKELSTTEHNDTWLKIESDDFYAIKGSFDNPTSTLAPRPQCQSDGNRGCPNGRSASGFFKVYINSLNFKWQTKTSDNDSHAIYVKFDTPGYYKIILDARSDFHLIDRIFLKKVGLNNDGRDENALISNCTTLSATSIISKENDIKLYPNPTTKFLTLDNLSNDDKTLYLKNINGVIIKKFETQETQLTIDMANLQSGIYFISYKSGSGYITKKVLKL